MLLLCFMCINLVLVSAENAKNNGHCEKNTALCKDVDQAIDIIKREKLLFYEINPAEGFNLRRDVYMRFAILLAEARKRVVNTNWHIVLPPWHALYHWKTESYKDPPKPWNMFFNIPSLSTFVPVMELHQLMQNTGRYGLKIDTVYILKNYATFDDGDFKDKWNVLGPCKYGGSYWGYRNITAERVICVEFQGSITQLWEVMNLQPDDRKIMFVHAEIPLHSSYGTKIYWDCRKSMQFNAELVLAADTYIKKELKCSTAKCTNYLGIHWRRQDFLRGNRSPSVKGTVDQIHQTNMNKSLHIRDIFIASDGTDKELKNLQKRLHSYRRYKAHIYKPEEPNIIAGKVAIIDQIICSRSLYFIGSQGSTFTYRIQEEREILGFDSDTTFNALCPDVGKCEKQSRWTIVH